MRNWLLRLLAGKRTVVINLGISQAKDIITLSMKNGGYIDNCSFDFPESILVFDDVCGGKYPEDFAPLKNINSSDVKWKFGRKKENA